MYAIKDLHDDTYVAGVNTRGDDFEAWVGEAGAAHRFPAITDALAFLQRFVTNHGSLAGRLTIVQLVPSGFTEVAL